MKRPYSGFNLSDEVKKKLKNKHLLKRELSSGKSAQDILEVTDSSMAEFYGAAYRLFANKRYKEAASAFLFLVTINSCNYEYWLGLGMSMQLCQRFELAIDAYEMAIICELINPVPYFYLSKCFFAMNDKENALHAIELAIEYSEESGEFEEIRRQALAAKRLLQKKL